MSTIKPETPLQTNKPRLSGCPGRRSIGSGPWSSGPPNPGASADAVTGAVLADPETLLHLIGNVSIIIGISAANV